MFSLKNTENILYTPKKNNCFFLSISKNHGFPWFLLIDTTIIKQKTNEMIKFFLILKQIFKILSWKRRQPTY